MQNVLLDHTDEDEEDGLQAIYSLVESYWLYW